LAGANLIYGAGMFESGITFDYGQLVMDNEFAALIKRFLTGMPVSEETLALDLIDEIGPKGDFLSCEHTLAHMHETATPKLFDRRVRVEWEADGASTVYERATKEAERVLTEHEVPPLPDEITEQMDAIIAKYDRLVATV
jgi:trimethylamine---corrinoid protein Co-methyltransferase